MIPSEDSTVFLQSVSDWMRDCPREERQTLGQRINEKAAILAPLHQSTSGLLYRQITLDSSHLIEAGLRCKLDERISSWTLSETVAQGLKGGVHPDTEFTMTVIFAVPATDGNVILNLDSLLTDASFQGQVEQLKSHIRHYSTGLGRWIGSESQHEVIFEIDSLPLSSVYAFGGFYRRVESLDKVWEKFGIDQDLANRLLGLTGIVPGSEKWVTDPDAVKRLVSKWVSHAAERA
jgi:hypothetical protein